MQSQDVSESNNELTKLQEMFPDKSVAQLESTLLNVITLDEANDTLLQREDDKGRVYSISDFLNFW